MRVGLIIYGSLDTLSGGYLYDRRLVEHLRGRGDTVEVVSFPWRAYPRRLLQNFEPGLEAAVRAHQVDVWLQDELNAPSLFWMNRRLRRRDFPPMVSIVHHLKCCEEHPLPARWLYRQVERAYLASVDGFIFNSLTTRSVVEGLAGPSRSAVVATPGGDRLGPGIAEDAIDRKAREAGPLRILFTGNLIPRKGLDTLLRGLAEIRTEDWILRVAGRQDVDPGYTRKIMDQVREDGLARRVYFLGGLPDAQLAREFAEAHVLAVPSGYEGFGIVYLEAMGFGLAVVASTAGAASELVETGKSGFLVPPGDAPAVARALQAYCRDRGLWAAHSHLARARFDRFPGWEKTTGCIRDFLVRLCAEK